jgi:aspartyl-tRNA synthetase
VGSEGVLIYHVAEDGTWKGAGAGRVSTYTREGINAALGAQSGDTVVMSAGSLSMTRALMGKVRSHVQS